MINKIIEMGFVKCLQPTRSSFSSQRFMQAGSKLRANNVRMRMMKEEKETLGNCAEDKSSLSASINFI